MTFRRIVRAIEALAVAASIVFVVMLFAGGSGDDGGGGGGEPSSPAAIFSASCARCHGADGGGGIGPALADVAAEFPDVEDQIRLVSGGIGTMPGFEGDLTEAQIRQVVEYTRTELGQ